MHKCITTRIDSSIPDLFTTSQSPSYIDLCCFKVTVSGLPVLIPRKHHWPGLQKVLPPVLLTTLKRLGYKKLLCNWCADYVNKLCLDLRVRSLSWINTEVLNQQSEWLVCNVLFSLYKSLSIHVLHICKNKVSFAASASRNHCKKKKRSIKPTRRVL
jgi:hypothetical protein